MYKYNLKIYFNSIAKKHGDQIALRMSQSESITYSGLNSISDQIALSLVYKGVQKRDVVCIEGEKTVYTYATMIACLKIGTVYSIFDPDSPVDRLMKIFHKCRPALIVASNFLANRIRNKTDENVCELVDPGNLINADIGYTADFEIDNMGLDITGDNPAYIMFTSGSTGFPKGAVMTHSNVINLIEWSRTAFNFGPGEVLTNVNPLYFDNSVFDFYSSLFTGACLVPFSKETIVDPLKLTQRVDDLGCTSWFSVPSMLIFLETMKALSSSRMSGIKRFIFGGEGYPKNRLQALYDIYGKNAELFNVYGPTECTCICSCYRITGDDFLAGDGLPLLGSLIQNFDHKILDENLNAVRDGEIGELYLCGPNVGKGYYNDKQLTNKSFIQNQKNELISELMYKTGDLVRKVDDSLHFVGRADNQIKHMGYRIELEEIENALTRLEHVSQAVAIHSHRNGFSKITAVIASLEELDVRSIRENLSELIPTYMIPDKFIIESNLPRNANGKVDRKSIKNKYSIAG